MTLAATDLTFATQKLHQRVPQKVGNNRHTNKFDLHAKKMTFWRKYHRNPGLAFGHFLENRARCVLQALRMAPLFTARR